MILWNINQLAERLKAGEVSHKEQFHYLLLVTVILVLGDFSVMHDAKTWGESEYALSYFLGVASIVGIVLCARANAKGDAKDLIVRVMCLSVPVAIRFMVYLFPIFFIFGLVEALLFYPEPVVDASIFSIIFTVFFVVAFYLKLISSIKKLATMPVNRSQ